jgi:2'-5' RNA ligase
MQAHYFIGISIPEPAAKKLAEARTQWKMHSHKKYTKPEDMHITLLFIGDDPHGEIEEAAEALGEIRHAPFDLTLDGIETFGNPATPRIVYASLSDSAELAELQSDIREKMLQFNMNPDQKRFVPHVTLAGKWAGGPPIDPRMDLEPLSFRVTEFTLFRIEPKGERKYIPVATYQLKEG